MYQSGYVDQIARVNFESMPIEAQRLSLLCADSVTVY
jgi:hypothetical protein